MDLQQVTNITQGRVIHIDETIVLPGQTVALDPERLKSRPIRLMTEGAEPMLKLGAMVDEDGELLDPPPKASAKPAAAPASNTPAKG